MIGGLTRSEILALATEAFGPVNRNLSTNHEVRFGAKGSKAVRLDTGAWFDHEADTGGYLKAEARPRAHENRKGTRKPAGKLFVDDETKTGAGGAFAALWQRGGSPANTPTQTYLRSRGVDVAASIRHVDDLDHHPTRTRWPAMLAAITDARDAGRLIGVHRTYLAKDGSGKAPVEPSRMILGNKKGGVIRLVPDEQIETRLGVAEGIETALTAMRAGWSCWAAIDAGNMARLPIWPSVDFAIFADNDPAGLKAANTLSARWREAGGNAVVMAPHESGKDWNDAA